VYGNAGGFRRKYGLLHLQKILFVKMDTRFLESFVTVVDSGSIAEAARRLNLTPAAVAQRIRTLESEIGAPLISRSGRTVRSTEAGAAILGRARDILGQVRDLKSMASSDVPSGELRLGAFANAISGILPGVLALLTKKYPQLDVYIRRCPSAEAYRGVLDGDLDAAIIIQPPFAIPKSCDWRVFREEPLIVLAPASMGNREAHELWQANRSFDMIAATGPDGWLTNICVGSGFGHASGLNSQGSKRLRRWWIGDWACPWYRIGRRHGPRACHSPSCLFQTPRAHAASA
jgi:DNA-binding transcriptional LysR family regulator